MGEDAERGELSRRPLKSRSSGWARSLAGGLCRAGVAPNAISAASVVFAAFAGANFVVFGWAAEGAVPWVGRVLLVSAAVWIQLRLVCNLMDGMVAVEGARRSSTGELWNEIPDRFADGLILVGAGFAAGMPWLGAAAAGAALMTAYVRALGASLTGRQDFAGPMAKPQRMAAMTAAAVVAAIFLGAAGTILQVFLWIAAVGGWLTVGRRIARLAVCLKEKGEA